MCGAWVDGGVVGELAVFPLLLELGVRNLGKAEEGTVGKLREGRKIRV